MLLAMLNGWEIVVILAVVLILFGAKRLPELARGLGQGIREFKKSSSEAAQDLQQALDQEETQSKQKLPPAADSINTSPPASPGA